jgi:hypothetical protein
MTLRKNIQRITATLNARTKRAIAKANAWTCKCKKGRFSKFNSTTRRTRCASAISNQTPHQRNRRKWDSLLLQGIFYSTAVPTIPSSQPMKQNNLGLTYFCESKTETTRLRGQQNRSFKRRTACCQGETGIIVVFAAVDACAVCSEISRSFHSGGGELNLSSGHKNERISGRFFASLLDIHLHVVEPPLWPH